jgi:hypothetical protein
MRRSQTSSNKKHDAPQNKKEDDEYLQGSVRSDEYAEIEIPSGAFHRDELDAFLTSIHKLGVELAGGGSGLENLPHVASHRRTTFESIAGIVKDLDDAGSILASGTRGENEDALKEDPLYQSFIDSLANLNDDHLVHGAENAAGNTENVAGSTKIVRVRDADDMLVQSAHVTRNEVYHNQHTEQHTSEPLDDLDTEKGTVETLSQQLSKEAYDNTEQRHDKLLGGKEAEKSAVDVSRAHVLDEVHDNEQTEKHDSKALADDTLVLQNTEQGIGVDMHQHTYKDMHKHVYDKSGHAESDTIALQNTEQAMGADMHGHTYDTTAEANDDIMGSSLPPFMRTPVHNGRPILEHVRHQPASHDLDGAAAQNAHTTHGLNGARNTHTSSSSDSNQVHRAMQQPPRAESESASENAFRSAWSDKRQDDEHAWQQERVAMRDAITHASEGQECIETISSALAVVCLTKRRVIATFGSAYSDDDTSSHRRSNGKLKIEVAHLSHVRNVSATPGHGFDIHGHAPLPDSGSPHHVLTAHVPSPEDTSELTAGPRPSPDSLHVPTSSQETGTVAGTVAGVKPQGVPSTRLLHSDAPAATYTDTQSPLLLRVHHAQFSPQEIDHFVAMVRATVGLDVDAHMHGSSMSTRSHVGEVYARTQSGEQNESDHDNLYRQSGHNVRKQQIHGMWTDVKEFTGDLYDDVGAKLDARGGNKHHVGGDAREYVYDNDAPQNQNDSVDILTQELIESETEETLPGSEEIRGKIRGFVGGVLAALLVTEDLDVVFVQLKAGKYEVNQVCICIHIHIYTHTYLRTIVRISKLCLCNYIHIYTHTLTGTYTTIYIHVIRLRDVAPNPQVIFIDFVRGISRATHPHFKHVHTGCDKHT